MAPEERAGVEGMTFLFSSFTGLPDRFFQGYGFIDHDYVFGDAGASATRNNTAGPWRQERTGATYRCEKAMTAMRSGSTTQG